VVVRFVTPTAQPGRVDVYDLAGRRVRTLLHDPSLPAGPHQLIWDGTDRRNASVSSGVYIFRVQSGAEAVTMKVTLLR